MNHQLKLTEGQRQITLLALAKLKHERPGWDFAISQIESQLGGNLDWPEESLGPGRQLLQNALEELVALQAHYARLLNQYDGGERTAFQSVEQWIERLEVLRRRKEATS